MNPTYRQRSSALLVLALLGTSAPALAQPSPRVPLRLSPGLSPEPAPRLTPSLRVAFGQGAADELSSGLSTPRLGALSLASPERSAPTRHRTAPPPPRVCLSNPVEIVRVTAPDARWTGSLTDCAGRPTARAMAALALIAQPGRAGPIDLAPALASLRAQWPAAGIALSDDLPAPPPARGHRPRPSTPVQPSQRVQRDPDTHDPWLEVAPRARVLHPRLLQMLQRIVLRFPGHRVELVSGYRPAPEGRRSESRHAHARALDFRLEGVSREALRDFVRTLPDAGVGYYPHSVFVHLDVREERAFWVDYSAPGERPRYGHWPPNGRDVQHEVNHLVRSVQREIDEAVEREQAPTPEQAPGLPRSPPEEESAE